MLGAKAVIPAGRVVVAIINDAVQSTIAPRCSSTRASYRRGASEACLFLRDLTSGCHAHMIHKAKGLISL